MGEDALRKPAGWYPDPKTGGTAYWDGYVWTGHERPPRRSFAARSSHPVWGWLLTITGVFYFPIAVAVHLDTSEGVAPAITGFLFAIALGAGLITWGTYLLRGRGPTTATAAADAQKRWERERAQSPIPADKKTPEPSLELPQADSVVNIHLDTGTRDLAQAEQIRALSDPSTSQALKNLQNLLYTRTITEDEYQAAKDRLLANFD